MYKDMRDRVEDVVNGMIGIVEKFSPAVVEQSLDGRQKKMLFNTPELAVVFIENDDCTFNFVSASIFKQEDVVATIFQDGSVILETPNENFVVDERMDPETHEKVVGEFEKRIERLSRI